MRASAQTGPPDNMGRNVLVYSNSSWIYAYALLFIETYHFVLLHPCHMKS